MALNFYSTFPPGNSPARGPLTRVLTPLPSPASQVNQVTDWRVNTLAQRPVVHLGGEGTFHDFEQRHLSGSAVSDGPAPDYLPQIGVNAPVPVAEIMGTEHVMGIPNGEDNVIWYDFQNFGGGMGGFPGIAGFGSSDALFSGHVDYHPHFTAVFWYLDRWSRETR